jgi:hypothetical protein
MSADEKVENQIQTLGYELIAEFGNELFKILDKHLTPKFGADWFLKTLKFKKGGMRPSSPKDVHTIVHQVVTEKNNDWRGAIAAEFQLSDYGKYAYKYFENILNSRNKWMHPDQNFSHNHLLSLVEAIHKIFGNRNHPLGDKCEEIFELLRSGTPFSFAMFSRAFGEDYLLALRQNQLLRDELMKFRDHTLNSPFNGNFREEELQNATRDELLDLVTQINNRRVVAVQDIFFYRHYGDRAAIRQQLHKNISQTAVLIGFLDEDIALNNSRLEVKLDGIPLKFSNPLDISHVRDLVRAYLAELAALISRIIDLSKEAGPDNCICKVCEILGPVCVDWFMDYDELWFSITAHMFNWRGFFGDSESFVLEELFGEEIVRMQLRNDFSDVEMGYIFKDYPGLTKEEREELREFKNRAKRLE